MVDIEPVLKAGEKPPIPVITAVLQSQPPFWAVLHLSLTILDQLVQLLQAGLTCLLWVSVL